MKRLFKNVLNSAKDFHASLKLFIFNSLGISEIKHESVYISVWYLTVFSLSLAINGLKNGFDFAPFCLFLISISMTVILVSIGIKCGKRKREKRGQTMKKTFIVVFLFIIFNVLSFPVETYDIDGKLNPEQKKQLLMDIVIRNSFINSASDLKVKKDSIGKFFTDRIYKKLKGNDILGYDFNEGFVFDSDGISIKELKTPGITAKYRKKFILVLRKELILRKIKVVKNSNIELGVALLDVEPELSLKSLPGALVEVFFKNKKSGKSFYYRFGTGKRAGLYAAFSDIWQIIFLTLESFGK